MKSVAVFNVSKTGDDILRNVKPLKNSFKNAISALSKSGVEAALKLELLDLVAKFSGSTNDQRHDGACAVLVADRRRHRVDELIFKFVLSFLRSKPRIKIRCIIVRIVRVGRRRNAETVGKIQGTGVQS